VGNTRGKKSCEDLTCDLKALCAVVQRYQEYGESAIEKRIGTGEVQFGAVSDCED
jgi:hypothetical protein